MGNKNHIKEISELFGIPKSTLRYWDSEGLINFERDKSNDYRRFSLKTILEISDVAFYRSLNVPINELKDLHKRDVEELEDIIKDSGRKVEAQILALQEMMKKIETRLKRIAQYREFLEQPYSLGKPNFQKMIKNHFMELEYNQKYISDPYGAATFFPVESENKYEFGFISGDTYIDQDFLWNIEESTMNFVHCLLKVDANYSNVDCYAEHRDYFNQKGYKMGNAVGRYLFTAYDGVLCDYYDGWIEIR